MRTQYQFWIDVSLGCILICLVGIHREKTLWDLWPFFEKQSCLSFNFWLKHWFQRTDIFHRTMNYRYLQFSYFSMSLLCNVICNVALRTTKQQQQHVQVWAFSIQKYRLITDLVWFGLVLIQVQLVHVKQHGKKYKCTCMSYCSHECQLELQALQTLLETSAPV